MLVCMLFKAWNRWLEHAMQVTRLRQNLGKVAARMQLGGLCKSWAIWRNVATLDRIDRVCKRVFERTRSMMLVGVGDTALRAFL